MPTEQFFSLSAQEQQRLEDAAIAEFASQPYDSASISAIISSAELPRARFYECFQDKADLYAHVLNLVGERKRALAAGMTPPAANLDTFAYLRWLLQIAVLFELRHPLLASVERRASLEPNPLRPEARMGDQAYFSDFLTQGILHDDIAPWVDTPMAAFLLSTLYPHLASHLVQRMGPKAESLRDGSVDIAYDPLTQDLFDNLMDLLEAGMAREPQIRKDFYSK